MDGGERHIVVRCEQGGRNPVLGLVQQTDNFIVSDVLQEISVQNVAVLIRQSVFVHHGLIGKKPLAAGQCIHSSANMSDPAVAKTNQVAHCFACAFVVVGIDDGQRLAVKGLLG
ncbi:hypothetical protein D3C84_923000 [compost metagenome]